MNGVMVTGASTPLGRAMIESLLEDDTVDRVLAVAVERRWSGPAGKKFTYLQADLTRSRWIRRLLFGPARDLGIRTIVHGPLHRSIRDKGRKVRRLNVESTRELLHLAERHPTIERFVFRSYGEVYRIGTDVGALIGEEHPLQLSAKVAQGVRDRVEADLTVCTRMGMTDKLSIVVLRCAELLCGDSGSQLYDYLESRVCLRPLGFDPMVQVLSVRDAVVAIQRAIQSEAQGVFNIPGADVLPLSKIIELAGRQDIPLPGPLLGPLYQARSLVKRAQFSYGLNRGRFHFSGILDGLRAEDELGYRPDHAIDWSMLRGGLPRSESPRAVQ